MATMENLIHNEYFQFIFILLVTVITARVFYFFMNNYMKKLAKKTKGKFDDNILKIITSPLCIFIILAGTYIALRSLTTFAQHDLWLNRLFFIASVVLASFIVSKILTILISDWLTVHRRFRRIPKLIGKIITITIYIIAFLMILSYFEIEISPLVATLGIGALAVGLALQDTLKNFFAGLHIISDKPVDVGDFIELEGEISGFVEDIGWRSTRIRTMRDTIIIIPNSKLAESTIINDSMPEQEIAVYVDCGVAYESDLKKVEDVTIEVAREIQKKIPGASKDFEPFIRYREFADSNINFRTILRVEEPVQKYLITHEFIKALKERYDAEGIEISWPIVKIYPRE